MVTLVKKRDTSAMKTVARIAGIAGVAGTVDGNDATNIDQSIPLKRKNHY